MLRPPPSSTLFPYTTLFRSQVRGVHVWHPGHPSKRRSPGWCRYGNSLPGERLRRGICASATLPGSDPHHCDSRADRRLDHIPPLRRRDRKSTRLNSSHVAVSYAVFCLKKKDECESILSC